MSNVLQVPAITATKLVTSRGIVLNLHPMPKPATNAANRDTFLVSAQRVTEEETPGNATHVAKRAIFLVIVLMASPMVLAVVAVEVVPASDAATMITGLVTVQISLVVVNLPRVSDAMLVASWVTSPMTAPTQATLELKCC